MANIIIETEDGTVLFHTDLGINRAKEICLSADIDYSDIYEVRDDELQFYVIVSRVHDVSMEQSIS